jgi:predicted O-methyltransferase YrrM
MNYNYNTLEEFYAANKINVTEGFSQQEAKQTSNLIRICKQVNPKNILEIGFNGGHSSEIFLQNSNAYVCSFDIGDHFHEYLKYGKQFINTRYPDRHTLVFGDSTKTVPNYSKNHPDIKYDIIFIDGGHDYPIAYADMLNCKNLAHKDTILIVDDIVRTSSLEAGHTIGPTKAWSQFKNANIIKELELHEWNKGRGMCVGKYNL